MTKLTQQNLEKALKDNKAYANAEPFISAMAAGSEQAIEIINTVFVEILCSDKVNLMAKLLVLRMFKDLFITGNIDAFDKIDPEVEQIIISAAAYNPKFRSKGKNDKESRGGMYFIDTEKRPKNTQNIQLGNSFVLLSTQIIKNFAEWLPETPDHQPSRFIQAQKELSTLGVSFDSNIYFQAEQAKKFKKNYEAWLKTYKNNAQNQKQSSIENVPQKQAQKDQSEPPKLTNPIVVPDLQQVQKAKQENQKLSGIIQQQAKQINKLKQQLADQEKKLHSQKEELEKQITSLKYSLVNQTQKTENLHKKLENMSALSHQNQKTEIQKLNEQKVSLEGQLKKINSIKNDALQRNHNLQIQIQQLKTECDQLKNELQNTRSEYHRSLAQKTLDSSQIKEGTIKKIQGLKQDLERQLSRIQSLLSQSQKLNKDYARKVETLSLKISDLETENQQLKQSLNQLKIAYQAEKIKPAEKYVEKTVPQSIHSIKQQIIQNKVKELQTQVKYATSNSFYEPLQEISNVQATGFVLQHKRSSNSLHKTQSSKFRQNRLFETQGTLNKSHMLFKRTEKNLVQKKANVGTSKNKNVITSVFPYLPQYFPQLFSQSQNFGACCLLDDRKYSTFFRNEMLELRLIKFKQNSRTFQIGIKNRTFDPLTLQIASGHDQIRIRQQVPMIKIGSLNETKLTLDAFITDLNFRVPILNIVIESKEWKRKLCKIPIPITLLNFTQLSQSLKILQRFDRLDEASYKKHRSDRVTINKQIHNLMEGFPQLNFSRGSDGGYEAKTIMTYSCIPEVQLKLILRSNQRCCEFETQFLVESKISEAFSKVILQVLMFILK